MYSDQPAGYTDHELRVLRGIQKEAANSKHTKDLQESDDNSESANSKEGNNLQCSHCGGDLPQANPYVGTCPHCGTDL